MGISSALGSQALVPAGFGFRNLIINGDFRINQRAFSSTTSSGTYGFDRWFTQHGGGTVTASAQTFTPGNAIQGQEPTNHIRMVTTGQTATNSFGIVCQKIEDVRNGAGQTVTVSFWAKANSGTPSVAIEFEQNFGSGGSPSATVNGIGAQKVVLSTSWNRYTLTFSIPSISSKTIGTTANTSFLQLNMWVSAGSDFNSRTGSLGIQSNTFDFWGVQVELNNVSTNFEQRPIGVELMLCQRYFQTISSGTLSAYNPYWNVALSGGDQRIMYPLKVSMRATPSVLTTGGSALHSFQYRSYNTGVSNSNLEANVAGTVDAHAINSFGYYSGNNSGNNLAGTLTVGTNNNPIWVSAEL